MGWEVLHDSDRGYFAMMCNTADIAFGNLINDHDQRAQDFYGWWSLKQLADPRSMSNGDVEKAVAEWNGIAERLGKDPDEETLLMLVGIYNGGGAYTWEHIPIDEIKPGDPLRLSRVTHRPSVMGMTPINPDGENHE